ncbi:MAG: T9SS type A sorting domain-containing protein, partial [Bacteroidales bacterium]|nr:T9SS type A sorting domain-containing protein [Bacteroidales bacterium]
VACPPPLDFNWSIWFFSVTDTTTVGLEHHNMQANSIVVYPNPADSYVIFENNGAQSTNHNQIQITNIYGQVMYTLEMNNSKTVLDTQDFTSGIYFYRIYNPTETLHSGKWVKR